MAQLTFLGAVGTVTGSRFLLEAEGRKVLIDCGLFQGPKENRQRNWDRFQVPPKEIDAVLLTHAHIDHIGYLPKLVRDGFKGPVYCTKPTAELARILLKDTAHLQEEDAEWANKKGYSKHRPALPLFNMRHAEIALRQFKAVNYGEQVDLTDTVRVKFKDAGHILGSSMIDVRVTNGKRRRKVLFCGDLGRPARAILRDPVQVYDVDYLVLESTYGDRLHNDSDFYDDIVRVINESVERGGVLVIPSFSVGRTQTLLYILRRFQEAGDIPDIPVYIDSPMAISALAVYERRIAQQRLSVRMEVVEGKDIFRLPKLHICESRHESRAINEVRERAIIISASGMVTGGRILHHMIERLPDERNTVLFIGYQAHGTRGRRILEGEPSVKIHGRHVDVGAHVENLTGLSGHADYNETLAWLMGFNRDPEHTFVVHGEPEASESLAARIRDTYQWDVTVPGFKDKYELDL